MSEKTTIVAVRIPESQVEAVDNWRRNQRKIPGLAEAVRTLIDRGLSMCETDKQRVSGTA